MSAGLSSDQIVKNEIIEELGFNKEDVELRIFPEGSNDDQKLFQNGGLTFGFNNVEYGSCDAAWYKENATWIDGYNDKKINEKPIIALEGTDALQRGSSGNAQYQRFHHALGAVKNGLIGVYYLKPGKLKVQPDLYGMAYFASKYEKGTYLIIQNLGIIDELLDIYVKYGEQSKELRKFLEECIDDMYNIWYREKFSQYNYDWSVFDDKRSTTIKNNIVIKYAGRNKRGFTDSTQRSGHIAVGEMYLTKYYHLGKKFYYLFPRFTHQDIIDLDNGKKNDKEWYLLRHEPDVFIKTMDDLKGLPLDIKNKLLKIKDEPLKGEALKIYTECSNIIFEMIKNDEIEII